MTLFDITGNNLLSNIKTVTGNYSMSISDGVILSNSPSANLTLTLPLASNIPGKYIDIKKIDAGGFQLIVTPQGGNLIDNQSSQVITDQYNSMTLISDGSNFWII
jgi:hypothetical protein